MLNFVTFMECVNAPNSTCLTSPGVLAPVFLTLMLVAVGALVARRDRKRFRELRAQGIWASFIILAYSVVVLAYFFLFAPDAVLGVEQSQIGNMLWISAIFAYGMGVATLVGMLGFAFGGWLVKRKRTPATAQRLVVAIDGPAASGKGTVAKRIAQHFGLPCLDTGLLYRAVARDVVAKGGALDDANAAAAAARALDAATLDDPNLRGPAAGDAASIVAKMPAVRAALLDYQRRFASDRRGAVLDDRDIGTVICPDADVKIFVTASAEERARRRHREHDARGEAITYEDVLADIRRRDARDSGREIAPLEAAADAITIDTTTLDADAAFAAARDVIVAKIASNPAAKKQ